MKKKENKYTNLEMEKWVLHLSVFRESPVNLDCYMMSSLFDDHLQNGAVNLPCLSPSPTSSSLLVSLLVE